jgi:hypothetical protein
MTMNRVRVLWQNWPGAPGYTNHYVGSAVLAQSAIRTFYDALKANIPTGLTIQVPSTGDQVNEATGAITGVWSGAVQAVVTGTAVGVYAGPVGACVNWRTGNIINGRRPMGRTFIVPLSQASFETNGTLSAAALALIQAAATQLITDLAGELKVWHRPNTAGPGANVTVLTAQVPDMGAVLRSRRQ